MRRFLLPVLIAAALTPAAGRAQLLDGHKGTVSAVAFSPDGKLLASGGGGLAIGGGGGEGELKLWDPVKKKHLRDLKGHKEMVLALAFSPDGRLLASASDDGKEEGGATLILWDVATGREAARFDNPFARALAFSPDGKSLITTNRNALVVYDVAARKLRRTVRSHRRQITSLAVSPDGKVLASASLDGTVCLRNLASMREMAVLRCGAAARWVGFSPKGGEVVVAAEGEIQFWDWQKGKKVSSHKEHTRPINQCAFVGSKELVSVGDDDVKFWDLQKKRVIISASKKGKADLAGGRCVAADRKGKVAVGAFYLNTFLALFNRGDD
jgi:WD40 repeat protein